MWPTNGPDSSELTALVPADVSAVLGREISRIWIVPRRKSRGVGRVPLIRLSALLDDRPATVGSLPPGGPGGRSLTAQRAQHLLERTIYLAAPAAVASVLALIHYDANFLAVLVFGSMFVTSAVLWPSRSPLHLIPVARTVTRFALPAAGLIPVMLPGLVSPWEVTPASALPLLIGAWTVTAFGMWIEASFDKNRPIRLAFIGSAELATKLAAEMRGMKVRGYVIVGHIGSEPTPVPDDGADEVIPWLGELSELPEIVQIIGVELLALGPECARLQVFEEAANGRLDLPVRIIPASEFYEDVLGHVPIGQIDSAWFQCIMHPRYTPSSRLSKRLLDLAVAGPLLLISAPVMLAVALAVRLSDGGNPLFRQRRVGAQGREFEMLKFRTMRPDASGPANALLKRELITPLGRFLRRTHLDELPQLWNVVRGDMTIVGPRPEQPALVEELSRIVPYYGRRSLVKPGVTGWAQLRCGYAGSPVGTAWKICHDLYYIRRRSIVFDLLIMIQTLSVLREPADRELEAPAAEFILGDTVGVVGR
jgi:lipopolysaccharide/colanic/teichoic acid biosynthesis glycosyltransferase